MGTFDGDSWRNMLESGNFFCQTPGISGFSFGSDRLDAGAWYHSGPAGGSDLGLENIGSPGMAQYFSLAYNILVAGSLIYWAYFAVVQRLSVMVSTISTLAVPLIAVLADAVMEASWPGWSDTGALMLVALAVILALTKSQKQKIHNR